MNRVLIRCHCCSWTGYGQIGLHLGKGLEGLGIPVAYDDLSTDALYYPVNPWMAERVDQDAADDLVLQLTSPNQLSPCPSRTVHFTMWESAGLDDLSTRILNRARGVIVPCSWCATVVSAAGVRRPLFVVPLGVSPAEGYEASAEPPADRVVFGIAGRMGHGGCRKGLNEAMEAFHLAFPRSVRDVALRVKVWPDCVPALRVPDDPRIVIDSDPATPADMAAWLRRLSCYVVPSKGEGWGLITHQAMACGRPVIAARWSGTAEFFDDRAGWELAYDLLPAGEFYAASGVWAVPRRESLIRTLRHVHSRPGRGELAAKGRAAAELAGRYTWERTARELRAALRALGWDV